MAGWKARRLSFVPFGVVVNRHLLLFCFVFNFFLPVCLSHLQDLVEDFDSSCAFFSSHTRARCCVGNFAGIVVLWFPEKHGDLVVSAVQADGGNFTAIPESSLFFNSIKIQARGRRLKTEDGRVDVNYDANTSADALLQRVKWNFYGVVKCCCLVSAGVNEGN